MKSWFNVDKEGLANQLERRGKSFAIFELIQNAWDSSTPRVEVRMSPIPNSPFVSLEVEDFSLEGIADLEHTYTMFAPSSRAGDPTKRGRFNLGEKTVISLCRRASIKSTSGMIKFDEKGRTRSKASKRASGTLFSGEIRMTRDELITVMSEIKRIIPPIPTFINGTQIKGPGEPLASFEAKLPTEIANDEGRITRTWRVGQVDIYPIDDMTGGVLEMGIPVVDADISCRANILQKVPLNTDRDNVTPAFLSALGVSIVNALHESLKEGIVTEPWVQTAIADSRISKDAFLSIQQKRFGERAVVAVPGDPQANANAAASGYVLVHGGSFSSGAWANAKKYQTLKSSSSLFHTPTPDEVEAVNQALGPVCPLCKKPRTVVDE